MSPCKLPFLQVGLEEKLTLLLIRKYQASIDRRSPILSLPPKRANSAIEASTMRTALETTIERRAEAREPVPLAGVVALDPVGLLLADVERPCGIRAA
jgi:hypothetical protein